MVSTVHFAGADTKRTRQNDKRRSRPIQPLGIKQMHLQVKCALAWTLLWVFAASRTEGAT
jgi:hypothetical protein